MAKPRPDLQFSLERARAVCTAAQGLARKPGTTLDMALDRHGFVRTLGGSDAYLALLCRVPGLTRAAVDAAVLGGEAKVVPAVRGCMYLIARSQVPLALRAADWISRAGREREQTKAGIQAGEMEALGKAVLETLAAKGPLTTEGIRKALPEGAVRNLGAAGKKAGITTTLPPSLRWLELDGGIERVPIDGRLDHERYHWRVPASDPFAAGPVPPTPEEAYSRLADLFFHNAGISTMTAFASWAGLSQRDAKAAIAHAGLVPAAIEGVTGACYVAEALLAGLDEIQENQTVALLPFEDNLVALHGGPAWFVEKAHHALQVPEWSSRSRGAPLAEAKHMSMRGVVVGDRIAGLWEYDPGPGEAVVGLFDGSASALGPRLEAAAAETGQFLRTEIGHGRSFSLDTDEALRERTAFVRSLG